MKHIKPKDRSRKGDFAEYYAVTWLWDNGYEVFQNCGCTGLVDLIAMNEDGKISLIDVKTFYKRSDRNGNIDNNSSRTEKQKQLGVKTLGFNPDTRELRFVDHKV